MVKLFKKKNKVLIKLKITSLSLSFMFFFFLLSVRNFSRVMHEATYRFNEIIVHFYIAGLYISNCVRIKETEYISYIYKTIHHGHRDTCKNYLLHVMYWYKFYVPVYIVVFNERKMRLLKLCALGI